MSFIILTLKNQTNLNATGDNNTNNNNNFIFVKGKIGQIYIDEKQENGRGKFCPILLSCTYLQIV